MERAPPIGEKGSFRSGTPLGVSPDCQLLPDSPSLCPPVLPLPRRAALLASAVPSLHSSLHLPSTSMTPFEPPAHPLPKDSRPAGSSKAACPTPNSKAHPLLREHLPDVEIGREFLEIYTHTNQQKGGGRVNWIFIKIKSFGSSKYILKRMKSPCHLPVPNLLFLHDSLVQVMIPSPTPQIPGRFLPFLQPETSSTPSIKPDSHYLDPQSQRQRPPSWSYFYTSPRWPLTGLPGLSSSYTHAVLTFQLPTAP